MVKEIKDPGVIVRIYAEIVEIIRYSMNGFLFQITESSPKAH